MKESLLLVILRILFRKRFKLIPTQNNIQMKYIFALFLSFYAFVITAQDTYQFQAVDVKHYVFHLKLNDQDNQIKGQTFITIQFKADNLQAFHLDLVAPYDSKGMRVNVVKENGKMLAFSQEKEILLVQLENKPQKEEIRTYEVVYAGEPADGLIISRNKYGERTFFGDNWANRAHHWLPIIDHPSDKATCEFKITAPIHYEVIANGKKIEESYLPDNMKFTHWKTDVPIPTKVMVIGVARFAINFLTTYNGISIESWVYPQNKEEGFADYSMAMNILRFFENQIGSYPYEKLANVQSKTKYGGMENASNIFYFENSITGKKSENIEKLIAHEIAHQWFGNSVSEKKWHHIWVSEGFATYFAELYLEHKNGKEALKTNMKKLQNEAIIFHQSNPNLPIVFEEIKDLNELLNTNSYQKGACVLHALRYELGDSLFWQSIRTYYQQFKNQNADTEDFKSVVEQVSGKELDWFFKQWLYTAGHPQIKTTWKYNKKSKTLKINILQKQKVVFSLSPEIYIYGKNNQLLFQQKINLQKKDTELSLALEEMPSEIVIDPENWILMEKE